MNIIISLWELVPTGLLWMQYYTRICYFFWECPRLLPLGWRFKNVWWDLIVFIFFKVLYSVPSISLYKIVIGKICNSDMKMAVFWVVTDVSVGKLLPDYTVQEPRRRLSSYTMMFVPENEVRVQYPRQRAHNLRPLICHYVRERYHNDLHLIYHCIRTTRNVQINCQIFEELEIKKVLKLIFHLFHRC
jgi:hypothetical protein